MKTMKFVVIFPFLIFFLAVHDYVVAQYQVLHSVFGNGGAAITNDSHRLSGTAGQPGIGVISNLSHINEAGFWYQAQDFITTIEQISNDLPKEFRLGQNYPNPFNPSTVINYQLPINSFVELSIYNLLGQKIVTLVSEQQPAGIHRLNWDARGLASGVYLYRLEVRNLSESLPRAKFRNAGQAFVETRKLILLP